MMAIATGTRMGRYEIRSLLGAGGMGEVYRARDPKLNRDVAIKVLPAAFSADPERLRRFEQEAQAAGALNHPNILAIYDVATHEGPPMWFRSSFMRKSAIDPPARRAGSACAEHTTRGQQRIGKCRHLAGLFARHEQEPRREWLGPSGRERGGIANDPLQYLDRRVARNGNQVQAGAADAGEEQEIAETKSAFRGPSSEDGILQDRQHEARVAARLHCQRPNRRRDRRTGIYRAMTAERLTHESFQGGADATVKAGRRRRIDAEVGAALALRKGGPDSLDWRQRPVQQFSQAARGRLTGWRLGYALLHD
jgi:hypothetical protein